MKDLRHTIATRCLENGINIKTIQKWMGHSNLQTTEQTYIDVLTDFETAESEKFDPHFDPYFDPPKIE